MCGWHDARHRVWDSIRGNVRAGDSMQVVARAYDVPLPLVELVMKYQNRTLAARSRAAIRARK